MEMNSKNNVPLEIKYEAAYKLLKISSLKYPSGVRWSQGKLRGEQKCIELILILIFLQIFLNTNWNFH